MAVGTEITLNIDNDKDVFAADMDGWGLRIGHEKPPAIIVSRETWS
jgi:hypothetical protein